MIKTIGPLLIIMTLAQSMSHVYVAALKGLSDIRFNICTSVISSFVICSLGSWILGVWCNLGILGVFIAITLDELTRGTVALIRFITKKWEITSQKERNIIKSLN